MEVLEYRYTELYVISPCDKNTTRLRTFKQTKQNDVLIVSQTIRCITWDAPEGFQQPFCFRHFRHELSKLSPHIGVLTRFSLHSV